MEASTLKTIHSRTLATDIFKTLKISDSNLAKEILFLPMKLIGKKLFVNKRNSTRVDRKV